MQSKKLQWLAAATVLAVVLLMASSMISYVQPTNTKKANNKIQVAILLDVSGSMDGLIAQAKSQLWNMVSLLGKTKCADSTNPSIEIALYEYGRDANDKKLGYVKQINSFINNLDSLSANLFSLTTNGGEEYCGEVIYQSIEQLPWDAGNNYKVIFIAGNEDFLQGERKFTDACALARDKGIIVNTIYCGDKQSGIREHWNLGGECGKGSYTNINANATFDIETPYDSMMYVYNNSLNSTYLGYNVAAAKAALAQTDADVLNIQHNKKAGLKRVATKAQSNVYDNSHWDLLDKVRRDGDGVFENLDKKYLPDSLKTKSISEIKDLVKKKQAERTQIQNDIVALNKKREEYIADYKKRKAVSDDSLETEVEKIIRNQVKRFNMDID